MDYKARYLYSELAKALDAKKRCEANPAQYSEAIEQWKETIKLLTDLLPSGSGFDSGTKLDASVSHAEKLVFNTSFHHMNDGGYYSGWTEHTVTVTPSFSGINLRISGRNLNDIKEYIHEAFDTALTQDVTYELLREHYPQFAVTSEWEEKDGSPSQCYQAFYVSGVRYWNDYGTARDIAARLMHEAWANKLKGV